MGEFKKSTNISGKYKALAVSDGQFLDPDTAEIIDVARELEKIYGTGTPFTLSTSTKVDEVIE